MTALLAGLSFRYFRPLWVGSMSTDNGVGHHCGKNGDFFVAVDHVTMTAAHSGLVYARLIRTNPCRLKIKGDEHPRNETRSLYNNNNNNNNNKTTIYKAQ